jgi:hypothetical protein
MPNSGLGRLHETFRFTSVTRSKSVSWTPWTTDQLVARPLPDTNTEKRIVNIHSELDFKLTVPMSARAKTVHALDHSATVTGSSNVGKLA